MIVRFPPIAALRALEAAARHLSYTRAAEELNVTQSAISHQIRHSEELWGLKLFERRGRHLVMTEQAQALVPIVRDFIRRLSDTLEELKSGDSREGLRLTLLQSFAFKWLVPRLGHFDAKHPEIDIWLSTTEDLIDFTMDNVDVGIRLGHGEWPRLHTTLLLKEYVFPVCSPRFLEKHGVPEQPLDLLKLPLLRRNPGDICPRWRDWFHDAGEDVKRIPMGKRFPDTSLAIQAALDDQGIALARSAHVSDDLKAGRLVKLFNVFSPSQVAYYLVCVQGREDEPAIQAFREWVVEEAAVAQKEFDAEVAEAKTLTAC